MHIRIPWYDEEYSPLSLSFMFCDCGITCMIGITLNYPLELEMFISSALQIYF